MITRKFLALLITAAFVLTACGSGKPSRPQAGVSGTPSAPATATPSRSPGGVPQGLGSITPSPRSTDKSEPQRPCTMVRYQSGATGVPGQTFIQADVTPMATWECPDFVPGAKCKIRFNGKYSVLTNEAYVEFQAWLPKSDTPDRSTLIGPLPPENEIRSWRFPYVVPDSDAVLFRLVLRDSTKREVADGDSFVFWPGCADKS